MWKGSNQRALAQPSTALDERLIASLLMSQVVKAIVDAHDSGELASALKDGEAGFGKWLKALGKEQGRKGKRLFMPTRVALTGSMHVRPTTSRIPSLTVTCPVCFCPVPMKGKDATSCLSLLEELSRSYKALSCRGQKLVVSWSYLRTRMGMSVNRAILLRLRTEYPSSRTGFPTKLEDCTSVLKGQTRHIYKVSKYDMTGTEILRQGLLTL